MNLHNEAYARYAVSEADDIVQRAYECDGEKFSESYQTALHLAINNYCALHEQAGERVAEFVQQLPWVNEPIMNALIGQRILILTDATLRNILEQDAEFRESLIGDVRSTNADDSQIARDAKSWDQTHNADKDVEIHESAQDGMVTDREVADAAYNGNSEQIESAIHDSHRNTLGETPTITLPQTRSLHDDLDITTPKADAPQRTIPNATKEDVTITVPKFNGESPSVVFKAATRWLCEHILMVATGSKQETRTPRLDAIRNADWKTAEGEPIALPSARIHQLCSTIRTQFARLRPPMVERAEEILDRMRNLPSNDPRDMLDSLRDVLDLFKQEKKNDDPYNLFGKHDDE